MNRREFLRLGALGYPALGLIGCGPRSSQMTRRDATTTPPTGSTGVFYPRPPSPPRIQYLATFAGENDVVEEISDFASFIVGDAEPRQHLVQPYGVEMYDGRIFVVDTALTGIVVFDLRRRRLDMILGSGGGAMHRPINVTVADDGTKYVCDTGRNQVLVYDPSDTFITAYGSEGQFKPVDCAVQGDRLYVVDIAYHQVHVLRLPDGGTEFRFGRAGSAAGELFHPTNLAIGPGGDIFVVETSNFRVQRFDPRGEHVRFYGSVGDGPGHFARPKGIAIDREGRIYVGDAAFENVQIFSESGQLLLPFGNPVSGFAGLNLPAAIAINYEDAALFSRYAAPGFDIDYVALVVSQFGPNKVDVFGYGTLAGADYSPRPPATPAAAPLPARGPAGLEPRVEP